MDRHILYGIVNNEIERPDAFLVEKFRNIPVSKIAKATDGNGLMNHEIKPITPDKQICGPAVTLFGRQGDANLYQGVGDSTNPGDVIVGDACGAKTLSVCGERIAYYIFCLKKVDGIVIDGSIRDKSGMLDIDVPIFYRSVDPKLYGATGPGAINVPIQCGGVLVNPGDLIIGDLDGVIAIPKKNINDVLCAIGGL